MLTKQIKDNKGRGGVKIAQKILLFKYSPLALFTTIYDIEYYLGNKKTILSVIAD